MLKVDGSTNNHLHRGIDLQLHLTDAD
jgi:hypothetical protein